MIATTAYSPIDQSAADLIKACAAVKHYMRRIPPDCRSKALAALNDLERRIRAGDAVCAGSADK